MTLIVSAEGLNKRFGAVTAAQDISVGIEQDSVVGLIGTNGAGKTTFINMVTGYLKPDSGRILFDGEDITQLSPREVTRRGISRSFQIAQLYNTLTVMENIMVALSVVLDNAGRSGFFAFADPIVPGFDRRPQDVANMLLERFQGLFDQFRRRVRKRWQLLYEDETGCGCDGKRQELVRSQCRYFGSGLYRLDRSA